MKIKVLTLEGEKSRQNNILAQLEQGGLKFEFFMGVDGRKTPHPLFGRYNESKRVLFKGEPLSIGQLGCFASHFLLWQECVELDEPLLIIEDDVRIDVARLAAAKDVLIKLNSEFECVRLFKNYCKHFRSFVAAESGGFVVNKYTKGPMSTMGYYVTPAAAKKFIQAADEWVLPVDIFMDQFWNNRVECYGMMPEIVSFDPDFDSIIGYVPKDKKTEMVHISKVTA
jgi:glycosyl transferase family 25